MKLKIILPAILMAVILTFEYCSVKSPKSPQLIESVNDFSFKLFSKLPEDQNQNTLVSPLSVSILMSMALNGAHGNTKTEISKALGLDSLTSDEINHIYRNLIKNLKKADSDVNLDIANSIWIRKDISVMHSFSNINRKYFNANIENLDFDQVGLNKINNWVSNKTNGKISKILDSLSPYDIMFLINTIYFDGEWMYPFKLKNTQNEKFRLSTGDTIVVPMMKLTETASFNYSDQPDFKALKIPYVAGKFSMLLILPKNKNTVEAMLKELDLKKWKDISGSLNYIGDIDLWLPRFQISTELKLKQVLSSMGIADVFTEGKADFSEISKIQRTFINEVIQKTYVKVYEKGTEVAVVTGLEVHTLSEHSLPPRFYVNRPFLFLIQSEDNGAILFMGKVENPLLLN